MSPIKKNQLSFILWTVFLSSCSKDGSVVGLSTSRQNLQGQELHTSWINSQSIRCRVESFGNLEHAMKVTVESLIAQSNNNLNVELSRKILLEEVDLIDQKKSRVLLSEVIKEEKSENRITFSKDDFSLSLFEKVTDNQKKGQMILEGDMAFSLSCESSEITDPPLEYGPDQARVDCASLDRTIRISAKKVIQGPLPECNTLDLSADCRIFYSPPSPYTTVVVTSLSDSKVIYTGELLNIFDPHLAVVYQADNFRFKMSPFVKEDHSFYGTYELENEIKELRCTNPVSGIADEAEGVPVGN